MNKKDVCTFYWSRTPGEFLNKKTGQSMSFGPKFTGTVREWIETLIDTIIDVATTMSPDAISFVCYVNRDVMTIIESSCLYHPTFGPGNVYGHLLQGKYKILVDDTINDPEIVVTTIIDDTCYVGHVKVLDMNYLTT